MSTKQMIPAVAGTVLDSTKPRSIQSELVKAGLIKEEEIVPQTTTAVPSNGTFEEPPLDANPTLQEQIREFVDGHNGKPTGRAVVKVPETSKPEEPADPLDQFDAHGYTPRMRAWMDHPGFGKLVDIFAHQRYMGSLMEGDMIERYIYSLIHEIPGISMTEDKSGNIVVDLGNNEHGVLWSCHTDTVHMPNEQSRQKVVITPSGFLRLARGDRHSCLGADDGTGVWLMTEMIEAGIPGRYIFHFGEERGCIGSRALLERNPELLKGMRFAIAFDRMGTGDIIHHQSGRRCASDAFVDSMAALLPPGYSGAHGAWTDTAVYMDVIPECTNISVGYYRQHGSEENQDLAHLYKLRDYMVKFDASKLVCQRDPAKSKREEEERYSSWASHFRSGKGGNTGTKVKVSTGSKALEEELALLSYQAGKGWHTLQPEVKDALIERFGGKHTRRRIRSYVRRVRAEQHRSREDMQRKFDALFKKDEEDTLDHGADGNEPIEQYPSYDTDLPEKPRSLLELTRNYGPELADSLELQGMTVDDFWSDILEGMGLITRG